MVVVGCPPARVSLHFSHRRGNWVVPTTTRITTGVRLFFHSSLCGRLFFYSPLNEKMSQKEEEGTEADTKMLIPNSIPWRKGQGIRRRGVSPSQIKVGVRVQCAQCAWAESRRIKKVKKKQNSKGERPGWRVLSANGISFLPKFHPSLLPSNWHTRQAREIHFLSFAQFFHFSFFFSIINRWNRLEGSD